MTLASNVLENLVKVYIEQYHGQDSKNLENTLRSIRSVLAGETIPEESPDLSPLEHLKGEDLEAKLQEILKIRPPLPQELGDETWKDPPEPRQWLAKDWLPAGEIALLTGKERGKTFEKITVSRHRGKPRACRGRMQAGHAIGGVCVRPPRCCRRYDRDNDALDAQH